MLPPGDTDEPLRGHGKNSAHMRARKPWPLELSCASLSRKYKPGAPGQFMAR